MEYVEILSPGDKLKLLRRKYKLKQEEISGDKITRNLISEIETNKANLTKSTAEIIFANLNTLSKKHNFDVSETIDYLMEDELAQANKILDGYISELKSFFPYKGKAFSKKLKDIESFLIKWDIKDKKIQIYELAGDYFSSINDYYKCILYYEKAFNLMDKLVYTPELLGLLKKMSRIYTYTDKYNESIECCRFALEHFPDMPKFFTSIFLYNSALSLNKLKQYNKAIENLEQAEHFIDKNDINKFIEIWNNKGICFLELKDYKKSLEIFNYICKLTDKNNDLEKFMVTTVNLINCYMGLKNTEKLNENLEIVTESFDNFISTDSEYLPDVCFDLGSIYKNINNLEKAEKYYLKALKFSKEQKNFIIAKESILNLIDIYSILNNTKKINRIEIEVTSLCNIQSKIITEVVLKLINFYSIHNMNSKINNLCEFAINFDY